jgi:hypothetical protein
MMGSTQPRWREFSALFLALIVFAQSYLIQSHVHPAVASPQHLTWTAPGSAGEDPATCPICAADMLAGAYVTPTLPQFAPLLAQAFVSRFAAVSRIDVSFRKYHWQSRAPPLS